MLFKIFSAHLSDTLVSHSIVSFLRLSIVSLSACLVLSGVGWSSDNNIIVAGKHKPNALIVINSDDPLLKKTAQWCINYLEDRGYCAEKQLLHRVDNTKSPVWVLETKDNCPVSKSLGLNCSFLSTARADAYILKVFRKNGRPVVLIVGRNVQGVRSGIARLVVLTGEKGDFLSVKPTLEKRTPFFPVRRIHICPTGRIAQGNDWDIAYGYPKSYKIWADTLWTNWSDERIKKYVEQLWLFGFNSIEVIECRGYRGVFTDEQLKNDITPKLCVMMKAAHDNGMEVSQFIWGQSLFEEGKNLCWNSPDEQQIIKSEYQRLAQTYGDLVDHIIVHVGDPGGCGRNGCDPYMTTQQLAMELLKQYRKLNPKVTATLNTWSNEGFWNGAKGTKFLDDTYSSKDVGIALHRWYDPNRAKIVEDSGRELDIWSWYMSDYEISLDMSLFMRRLDKYFSSLPEQASKQVTAISTEINFHGWPQIINAYVSAQKMWSPKRDLAQIEREFCAATYGEQNADAMVNVYRACEAFVHPDRYYGFIPATDCLPDIFGTAEYNRTLRKALEVSKSIKFDMRKQPKFTCATAPEALKDYLICNLNVISIFSEAQEKINTAKAANASQAELQTIVNNAENDATPYAIDLDYPVLQTRLKSSIESK